MKTCITFGTRFYSLAQVVDLTGLNRKYCRKKVWKLEASGLVRRIRSRNVPLPNFSRGRPHKEIIYQNTPKLLRSRDSRSAGNNGWDKMWQAVRVLRSFTRNELAAVCSQSISNVQFFTKRYRKLGYIKPTRDKGRNVIWVLTKNAGSLRPLWNDHAG